MQMTKTYCFWSFALGSTHVKFDVWPGPKNTFCGFMVLWFYANYAAVAMCFSKLKPSVIKKAFSYLCSWLPLIIFDILVS